MAGWGFSRGLVLNQLKRQLDSTSCRTLFTTLRCTGGYAPAHGGEHEIQPIKCKIGKREVVGYGGNGEESYYDCPMAPFPAIRFKEDTGEIVKLREKEKGDWKKMTVEEKKALYRASFCQTLSECTAPTGEWKMIIGIVATIIGIGLWGFFWMKIYGKQTFKKNL